ncbi:HK97 family phage prohead protease [Aerococcaceae bacterium WGS1372]
MKELRIATIQTEERNDNQNELVLVGTPILYDTPTTIGAGTATYTEVIQRGALDGVNLNDTRLLYNHDMNKVPLARTPKTMQLSLNQAGLEMRAELANTEEARSVWMAIQRGDLSGMSFAFKVSDEGQKWEKRADGNLYRTITKIDNLYEISVVPFPAYPTTSVEARSIVTNFANRDELKIKLNKIIFKGEL